MTESSGTGMAAYDAEAHRPDAPLQKPPADVEVSIAMQGPDNVAFLRAIRGELHEGEHLWVTGFVDDPNALKFDPQLAARVWKGHAVFPGKPLVPPLDPRHNNYFSVAILKGGAKKIGNFARLAALVADDADRAMLTREPSWTLQTSESKFQIAFILRDDDPNVYDKALAARAVEAVAKLGTVGADKSGNSLVRYARLPVGTNTKSSQPTPFLQELVEWRPEVRVTLAEALEAFGVPWHAVASPSAAGPATTMQPIGTGASAVPVLTPGEGSTIDAPTLKRFSVQLLESALKVLDPNMQYDPWLRVGMALHHETEGAQDGLAAWDAWSSRAGKYVGVADLETHWDSFGKGPRDRSVTGGTIIKMAKETGKWSEPVADDFERYGVDATRIRSASYGAGRFELRGADGVFYIGVDKDGGDKPALWICSYLSVLASTRTEDSNEWGRMLEWCDEDRVMHRWAMPMELLEGDGLEVRREFARRGLRISTNKAARDLLATYLKIWPTQDRARCVDRLGWNDNVYVTPSKSIGERAGERVVFQNPASLETAISIAGGVDEWRAGVAMQAVGNSRLAFALALAFAAPLAELVGEDSGGFHLRGASSSGKTTAARLAASVWGNPINYVRTWRATANGLEGIAGLHNDNILILDEMGQCDPKEIGHAAYMLANGQGKGRATRAGNAKPPTRWRTMLLSTGEVSLSALMAQNGKRANAGQEVRLADIPADAGAGMGIFEDLHHAGSPASFATALKDASLRWYGAVGDKWLHHVVAERGALTNDLGDGIRGFTKSALPHGAAGQVERVAQRFGLVAAAGELATRYGLTGWPEGEATRAARTCFDAWLANFGGAGNREDQAILSQVQAFFEQHGASRFQRWGGDDDAIDDVGDEKVLVIKRAGYYRTNETGVREFYVLPEAFRQEVCEGLDFKTVLKVLVDAGWLIKAKDNRFTHKPRLPGMGATRCYRIGPKMWEGRDD